MEHVRSILTAADVSQLPIRDRVGLVIQATDVGTAMSKIREAEQAGVYQVWMTQSMGMVDTLTFFAAAATHTTRIQLGTSIVPIYPRHPLVMALQGATIEALAPGRLRLGVGTSHRHVIENMYGLSMPSPLAYVREYVEVMRQALWEGRVDHQGRFFKVASSFPRQGRVPLLISALGEKAFGLAAEIADGAISWMCPVPYLLDTALPALEAGAQAQGRPVPPLVAHIPVAMSTDEAPDLSQKGRTVMNEEPVEALHKNIDFVSYSDQGGRGDGVQIMVHKGHAYIGHMFSNGVTVMDVSDAKRPRPVNFLPTPANTWSIHLQTSDDLLLVINGVNIYSPTLRIQKKEYYSQSFADTFGKQQLEFSAGMRVYDISKPDQPREVGFMPVEGFGLHRIWYVGGRYAYASASLAGFTDHIFLVIDMADPTHPRVVGRWWIPGMWREGGETPTWQSGRRYALHHAIVAGTTAYGSWRDGGLTLLDVSDPSLPQLIAHRNWCPPFGGGTHSSLPLPERNLVIVADEAVLDNCADQVKYTWVVDVREPTNPVTIATFPTPWEEDYCAKGGHFGPHNLHENRPGSFQSSELIFVTYQNAGVRVFEVKNQFRPEEVAYFVPPAPQRMFDPRPASAQVIQSCDVFVDREGLLYVTDYNAGLYILEYNGK